MNNAPFSIGQKVVCVETKCGYVRDETYIVGFIDYCPNCKVWHVGCIESGYFQQRCGCGHIGKGTTLAVVRSKYFAPIQTQYNDATAEILENFKQTSETPDKIIVPETETA